MEEEHRSSAASLEDNALPGDSIPLFQPKPHATAKAHSLCRQESLGSHTLLHFSLLAADELLIKSCSEKQVPNSTADLQERKFLLGVFLHACVCVTMAGIKPLAK